MTKPRDLFDEDKGKAATELFTDGALDSLRDEWKGLFDASGVINPFLSYVWAKACWGHLAAGEQPLAVLARRDDRLVGVAAFKIVPARPWTRKLTFLSPDRHDYGGMLVEDNDPQVAEALLEAVLTHQGFDRIDLFGVREDDPLLPIMRAALSRAGRLVETADTIAPHVALTQPFEDYLKSRSRNTRNYIRKAHNRISRESIDVSLWRADTLDERQLEDIFRVHVARNVGKYGISKFEHERIRQFYAELSSLLGGRGWLDVAGIELDGRLAAFSYGMRLDKTYFYWIAAINPELSSYSPGALLLEHLVKSCTDERIELFDMMAGTESYKYKWATGEIATHRLICDLPGHAVRHWAQSAAERARMRLKTAKDGSRPLQAMWRKVTRIE